MKIFRGIARSSDRKPVALAIGNFDGVHRGHRTVIARAAQIAKDGGHRLIAVTFDPHPMAVLRPEHAPVMLTSLGTLTFPIIQERVEQIVTVSEQAIVDSMKFVWERVKIVIEPSSAVPLACLLERTLDMAGKRVGVILSGGNVDLDRLPWQP